jgi:Rieske Fe-S protein
VIVRYISPPKAEAAEAVSVDAGDVMGYGAEPVKVIREGRRALIVLKGQHDQFRAFSAKCTHLGCIVEYQPAETRFKCNCHGSAFDLQGIPLNGPASKPLQPYRIEVKGDRVVVTVI